MSGRAERESTRTVKGRKGGVERPAAQSARTRPASTTTRGTRGARLLTVRGRSVGRTNKEMKCRWERSERGQSPRRSPVTTIGITRHAPCAGCIRSSCVRDCHPQGRDGQGRQDRMMKGWLGSRDRQALAAAKARWRQQSWRQTPQIPSQTRAYDTPVLMMSGGPKRRLATACLLTVSKIIA